MKHLAPASSQTLRRGLAIIRLLTRVGPSGLSVSEISRRVDLNKATTIRLVAALLDEGFVLRDQISSRY